MATNSIRNPDYMSRLTVVTRLIVERFKKCLQSYSVKRITQKKELKTAKNNLKTLLSLTNILLIIWLVITILTNEWLQFNK